MEHETRAKQQGDFVKVVKDFMFNPEEKATFQIPLCRLQPLAVVRPIIEADVLMLEKEFVNGYRVGDRVLFVAMYNHKNEALQMTEEMKSNWSPLWRAENDKFEAQLAADPDLVQFMDKMFFVWEGNHRVTAWYRHVNRIHPDEEKWHISPMYICLNVFGRAAKIINAMNDVNWYYISLLLFFRI